MIVNLIKEKQMFSMTLPPKIKGQYWVTDCDDNGKARKLISIEAISGQWVIKSNKRAGVLDNEGNATDHVLVKPLGFVNIKIRGSTERILLYSEPISLSRQLYAKYLLKDSCELLIGRADNNHICIDNPFVSGQHAKLIFDRNSWSITDINSTNGTFVNGYRVTSAPLHVGDCIYIMGLKLVVGNYFFAINNPDRSVNIQSVSAVPFQKQEAVPREEDHEVQALTYFYRSPRFKRGIETAKITVDPPPQQQRLEQVPLALMLGPSMTMGFTALSTGLLTLNNVISNGGDITSALPSLMMSFSMLLGTVLWPILTKRYERRQRIKNEKKRQEKYLAYLDSIRDEIKWKCKEQVDILYENVISIEECSERIMLSKRTLWERMPGQDDFLRLRLGIGDLALDAEIKYPEKHFTLEDDNLQDAVFSLSDEPQVLEDVPVSISLVEKFIAGMIGTRSKVLSMIKSVLLQIIALHSYDEVKIVLIADQEEWKEWQYIKWFPHIWNDGKTIRYLATSFDEIKELSVILEKNICSREDDSRDDYQSCQPYYIILSASKELADKCESFHQLLKYKNNRGFSIITLYDEIKNIPKETMAVVEINGDKSKIFDKDDITGKHIAFCSDKMNASIIRKTSKTIANIQMDLSSQRFTLPNMVTFLEMFSVGKIEHLNSFTRWKENNPTITLQTPIGVDTSGEPFLLDLHEKFHGPHGLVAGMTGSGKSEFIITYILSLAVNYHPDEVAFILIDYKGGGLTGAFENSDKGIKLPHLAGTITNLDGAAIQRSLISIQSELRRRQAVFNEARKISNEGTMDIYKYQQLYREKVVTEPVPHLFIISDEFAELKTQQPEFMEQLVSAARIGRSLGVHLILATQKPSGVVDDQIWSNSKFRICLKVQEKADSMEMIKCPDAAELSQTGRFYLQVGFNELFALGQSAWCGAKYVPTENVEKHVDQNIQVVDNLGRVLKEIKPNKKQKGPPAKTKQIVEIVNYLSALAIEEKIYIRPLWLDPIPDMIYVEPLEEKYQYAFSNENLNPIIGEYDDPFNQSQNLLTLPLSEEGNCIIYGATGTGKATFLSTIVFSIIKNYDAQHVNLYIMDFGADTLRAFEKAPQVGDVLFSYESEKINNLFKMLVSELEHRKKSFAQYGGDYASYYRNSGNIVPNIVVIVNNYAGFLEQYEDLNDVFTSLSCDGIKYGILFVVSASNTNAVRYRTQQNFKQLITLQLNDPTDYSIIVGRTEGLQPSKYKGRGLVKLDRVYEFQTAHCVQSKDIYASMQGFSQKLADQASVFAKKVPILPEIVNFEAVRQDITTTKKVPMGISKKSLEAVCVDLTSKYIYPVLSQDEHVVSSFVQVLVQVLNESRTKVIVLDSGQYLVQERLGNCLHLTDSFEEAVQDLFAEVVERNNQYKDAKMNAKVLENRSEMCIVLLGVKRIMEFLTDDGKDKMNVMLEKGEAVYKVHFILAEESGQVSGFSYETWYKTHISGTEGVWIGDGFTDQYTLKTSKMTSDLYAEIGEEFGYCINRGRPFLMKVLCDKEEEAIE